MIRGVLFLAIFGIAFASDSANQYIDNVINSALPSALRDLGLAPASLPNFHVKFGEQQIYQNHGEAEFHMGTAKFTSIRRASDCSGPRTVVGEVTVNCTLKLYPLTTEYKVALRNGTTLIYTRSMGHVSETLLDVVISGRSTGSVRSLQITKLGDITTTYSGLPTTMNKYIKVLNDAYKINVSSSLINVIQQKFVNALNRALANTPMPR